MPRHLDSNSRPTSARGGIVVVKQKEVLWKDAPPAHHANDSRTRFRNPWPSFRPMRALSLLKLLATLPFSWPKIPADLAQRIPSQIPDWGAGKSPDGIKATWLGHAAFLVELPTPPGAARGPRILFDPVLSHRCSPVQWLGPARLLPTPCAAEDIPEVDAVVLSHNHYDHMDFPTLSTVHALHRPHFFAPLGNTPHLASLGIAPSHIHVFDWWEECAITVALPPNPSGSAGGDRDAGAEKTTFVLACTPAQHTANRSVFDRWHTLWASWVIIEGDGGRFNPSARVQSDMSSDASSAATAPAVRLSPRKVYFAGDTGYRTVYEGEDEESVPRCPAFKQVGEKYGGFDLALLPIGAYHPRWQWSGLHASPGDAVEIFKDVRAERALAMHWGTFTLTLEPTTEPPELLKEECAKAGLAEGVFTVCGFGETTVV